MVILNNYLVLDGTESVKIKVCIKNVLKIFDFYLGWEAHYFQ